MKQAEDFIKACDAYYEHSEKAALLQARRSVAEADGDEEALLSAGAAVKAHHENWYDLYCARKETAEQLCSALGVPPKELKGAL